MNSTVEELRLELSYYELQLATHLAELDKEEKHYKAAPDEYNMPLEEVQFYALWKRQVEICQQNITFFKQEIQKLYG